MIIVLLFCFPVFSHWMWFILFCLHPSSWGLSTIYSLYGECCLNVFGTFLALNFKVFLGFICL